MATASSTMVTGRASAIRWYGDRLREWAAQTRREILPAFARPNPAAWSNERLSAAWLGHATVLINFFGFNIITDPVLFARIGIRLAGLTIGPKRLTAPALRFAELPRIDLVLISHAHFDHLDTRTLHRFSKSTSVVTALRSSDLLRQMRFGSVQELRWNEETKLRNDRGALRVRAFEVRHWGARLQYDNYRGYNGYVLERNGHRIIFGGDTAMTDNFATLHDGRGFDLAIMSIGAYDPWIRVHCTPEQAIAMASAAGAEHIMPVHHQTFRLSAEPFREPIERFEAALQQTPHRVALREIGETFELRP